MSNLLNLRNQKIFPDRDKRNSNDNKKSPVSDSENDHRSENLIGKSDQPQIMAESFRASKKPMAEPTEAAEWEALEFIKYSKTPEWFLAGGLFFGTLFLFALFVKNFIFALIVILAAFSIYIWTQKDPKTVRFAINSKGIKIQNSFYGFDNLKSFWIFNEPPDVKYISLESKKVLMPKIIIPLGDRDPEEIRKFLLRFLSEEEQEESLIDVLARYAKY